MTEMDDRRWECYQCGHKELDLDYVSVHGCPNCHEDKASGFLVSNADTDPPKEDNMDRDLIKELVDFSGWDEGEPGTMEFYEATFKKDFGSWKKGQTVETLAINFRQGVMESYHKGSVVLSTKFDLQPIPE